MSNKYKATLNYNDTSISIAVFNNVADRANILFNDMIALEPDTIKKGFIINKEKVVQHTKVLLKKAINFTKWEIQKIYVTFDTTNDVEQNIAEIQEANLDDGVFDKTVWEKVKSSFNIQQITDKYIYAIADHSWKIDGKEYKTFPKEQVYGSKLVIKTNVYKYNKTYFQQYSSIFKSLQIEPIWIKPVVATFNSLTSTDDMNHAELFIYLNDASTIICHVHGDKIVRFDNFKELGLDVLYNAIAESTNIDTSYIKKILNTAGSFNSSFKNIEIINGFNLRNSNFEKIKWDSIIKYIESFAKSLVKCKNDCIEHMRGKGIEYKRITFVPKDSLTAKIINLTQIHNDSKTINYIQNHFIDEDEKYNQLSLTVNSVIKTNEEKEYKINRTNTAEDNKSFMGFLKGE